MFRAISTFILLLLNFGGCVHRFQPDPKLFLMDYYYLNEIKSRIREKSPIHLPAYTRLCKEAENALLKNYNFYISGQDLILNSTAPINHLEKVVPLNKNTNKHDHPKQLDGNHPINHENVIKLNDQHFLEMTSDISTLTLAWFFSKEDRYADKATKLIVSWFINSKKNRINNANQNERFLQEMQFNAISLFTARKYIDILDAITLLETGAFWNKRDTGKVKNWFSNYLQWLLMSKAGLDEISQTDFRGTWFDAQMVVYALFSDKKEVGKNTIEHSLTKRIPGQFDEKGLQKHELFSSQSFTNSCFNIEGHLLIGKIAGYMEIDYWNDPIMPIQSIQAACDYLFSFIGKEDQWPFPQSEPIELSRMVKLIKESEKIFKNPEYKKYMEILKPAIKSNNRLIITN